MRSEFLSTELNSNVIIDSHTHNGSDLSNIVKFRYPSSQSIIDLTNKTKLSGVDYVVTFPCPSDLFWFEPATFHQRNKLVVQSSPIEPFPHFISNETMFREIANFGQGRALPFANFIPSFEDTRQIEYLETKIKEDSLFGLKFHPLASQTSMALLKDSPIIDFAQRHDLPILIHTGPDKYSNPLQLLELSRSYPNVRFCAAHVGQFQKNFIEPLVNEKPRNLFIDTSPLISLCFANRENISPNIYDLPFSDPQKTLHSLYSKIPDNILWGTDEPWTTITNDKTGGVYCRVTYSDEVNLLKTLPTEAVQKIANKNTLRFLGQ
ncbi:MAG: amidohydrolase family protein [Candidatus Shapirobacteria bacterium]